MSEIDPDALFDRFAEEFCRTGAVQVPPEWPEDLRRRCLFFARMIQGAEPDATATLSGSDSVLASLSVRGVQAEVSLGAPEPPAEVPLDSASATGWSESRYVVERELARGGMGRVLLAYDRDFRRRVAVKVMLGTVDETSRASRFLGEAQATAQLEHPNIGPVYDLGVNPEGAPFFTMRWIRGRDLSDVLHQGDGDGRPLSLVRLLQMLQQGAMGVDFANARGVVHRDLKPQNVMVGDFGEVLVVDWGLAKVFGDRDDGSPDGIEAGGGGAEDGGPDDGGPTRDDDPISTARGDSVDGTIAGRIHGSPAYMAPEQARGEVDAIDARTDVFGLGAILYEMLTGSAPYTDDSLQVALGRARRGDVVPPREAAGPDREIPAALDATCRRALAPEKGDRFQSARELYEELQRFIEGIHDEERRAAEADRLRAVADGLHAEQRSAAEHVERLRAEESRLREELAPDDAETRKEPLWELSARVESAAQEARDAFSRTTAAYQSVLAIQPSDRSSRAALAAMYHERLLATEERGDRDGAALYESLVMQYDDGRYQRELEADGRLQVRTEPDGVAVFLSRYEERGPLLVGTEEVPIGRTPLERDLPRGSYLLQMRAERWSEARCPVVIERGGVCRVDVRMRREGEIASGFVQIPAGRSIVGGNAAEYSSLPWAKVDVGELFVGRYPVTLGEYCRFLNARFDGAATASDEELRDHLPAFGSDEYVERVGGEWVAIERLGPDVPAIALPVAAAEAYCRWLGGEIGRRVRWLEEEEWERCARGADGRLYPWGDGFDWSFCKGRASRRGKPFPEPVGAFARDESPFGVRDLAGGVRELCAICPADPARVWGDGDRPLRGGSWFNPYPFVFRADCRTSRGDRTRTTDAGFRVAYDEREPQPQAKT